MVEIVSVFWIHRHLMNYFWITCKAWEFCPESGLPCPHLNTITFENLHPWRLGMWSGLCLEELPISCSDGLDFNSGINISRWARLPGSPDINGKYLCFVSSIDLVCELFPLEERGVFQLCFLPQSLCTKPFPPLKKKVYPADVPCYQSSIIIIIIIIKHPKGCSKLCFCFVP